MIYGYLKKMYFRPISALCSKFYPGIILPVVKLFACLGVFAYLTSNENPSFSRHRYNLSAAGGEAFYDTDNKEQS